MNRALKRQRGRCATGNRASRRHATGSGFTPGGGFTLIEMLVAMALTLLIMASVATLFSNMTDSMADSRAAIEMADRLRGAQNRLQSDLAGITVTMLPPRRPESGEGYFEYIEGVIGPIVRPGMVISGNPNTSELEQAQLVAPTDEDLDGDGTNDPDTTLGDNDDILMFTTRNLDEPFVGRFAGGTTESPVAEVIWFVRGTTLYRRVLLVAPNLTSQLPALPLASGDNFYAEYDISARLDGNHTWQRKFLGSSSPPAHLVANSLGDLTKRENRYGHQPFAFPHDARFWGRLGMPTLRESAHPTHTENGQPHLGWPFPDLSNTGTFVEKQSPIYGDSKSKLIVPKNITAADPGTTNVEMVQLTNVAGSNGFDAWNDPFPWAETDKVSGTLREYLDDDDPRRGAEDAILTNVLSFDVKVWDPGAPVFADSNGNAIVQGDPGYVDLLSSSSSTILSYGSYVDLNYMADNSGQPYTVATGAPVPLFNGPGDARSRLQGTAPPASPTDTTKFLAAVYDTWSTHYEHDGFDQGDYNGVASGTIDEATNGFDDNRTDTNNRGIDDESELEAPPPYAHPLRGVQVTIRVFEPDSRQIREIIVQQEFLPQ